MKARLSAEGRVVLPAPIRRILGLQAGDFLEVLVQGGGVLLTPRRKRSRKVRILVDPITRLPVLSAGPGAPILTSEQVRKIFEELPRAD